MIFLLVWYLVLVLVIMPLDSKLSRRHRWFAPPVVALLYLGGSALFYRPSLSDLEEAQAAVAAFRAMPVEWQMVFGFAFAFPVLWQATGAAVEWKAMKQRHRNTQAEQH